MSAYGNPQPYDTVSLERYALTGRINFARTMVRIYQGRDPKRAALWSDIADELLDHLNELDARVTTAEMQSGGRDNIN